MLTGEQATLPDLPRTSQEVTDGCRCRHLAMLFAECSRTPPLTCIDDPRED